MNCFDELIRFKSGLSFLKFLMNRLKRVYKDENNIEFIVKNKLLSKCKRNITREVISKFASITAN